jgi:hypothetical protein
MTKPTLADAVLTPEQVRGGRDRLTAFPQQYPPRYYHAEQSITLWQVPPSGFVRLRHSSFLANRLRQEQPAQCRALLGAAPTSADVPSRNPAAPDASAAERAHDTRSPVCGEGRTVILEWLALIPIGPRGVERFAECPGFDTSGTPRAQGNQPRRLRPLAAVAWGIPAGPRIVSKVRLGSLGAAKASLHTSETILFILGTNSRRGSAGMVDC